MLVAKAAVGGPKRIWLLGDGPLQQHDRLLIKATACPVGPHLNTAYHVLWDVFERK